MCCWCVGDENSLGGCVVSDANRLGRCFLVTQMALVVGDANGLGGYIVRE